MKANLHPMSEFVRLLHSYGHLSVTQSGNHKERRYFLLIDAYHQFLIAFEYFEESGGVQLLETSLEMFYDAGFKYQFEAHLTYEKWYEGFQLMHDALMEYIKKGYGS